MSSELETMYLQEILTYFGGVQAIHMVTMIDFRFKTKS